MAEKRALARCILKISGMLSGSLDFVIIVRLQKMSPIVFRIPQLGIKFLLRKLDGSVFDLLPI